MVFVRTQTQLRRGSQRVYSFVLHSRNVTSVGSRHASYLRSLSTVSKRRGSLSDGTSPQVADLDQILARPTWSVEALLPAPPSHSGTASQEPRPHMPKQRHGSHVTPTQLRHLLRLSALPLPESTAEETKMIEVLRAQLHFVRAIQAVDTSGVEPLTAIRDETSVGRKEQTIGLTQLQEALSCEVPSGRCRRPKRRSHAGSCNSSSDPWDVFQAASVKSGRYFVVESQEAPETA